MIVPRRIAAVGVLAAAGLLATVTAAGSAGASQPQRGQHRQIGAAELSEFKVVLTATRGSGQPPGATVTAAGYRRSGAGWTLIAIRRIGAPDQWFWYAVQVCSLRTTEFHGVSPVRAVDSVTVSLLATPALGCTKPFHEHWKP